MNKIRQFILLLLIIPVFCACKKDKSPVIPLEEVAGYSCFYDINGIKSIDNSGIAISLEGYPISTTTKSDGSWIFSHLKSGTYTFVFSRPGFGTMKICGKRIIGGYQSLDVVSLFPIPQYNITLTSDSASPGVVNIFGFFSGTLPLVPPCFHMFFGKDANVSADAGNYSIDWGQSMIGSEALMGFGLSFGAGFFTNNGFKSGDKVYVVAYTDYLITDTYPLPPSPYIFYTDLTGRKIFPNLNPTKSNTLSFVLL